jgi:hypothetical protein
MTVASFPGMRVAGGLLPADVLSRLVVGRGVEALMTADFHLGAGASSETSNPSQNSTTRVAGAAASGHQVPACAAAVTPATA